MLQEYSMPMQHKQRLFHVSAARKEAGMTLVELMFGVVIGLLAGLELKYKTYT